jgi:TnpA family transposase
MRTLLWSYLGQRQFPREMSRFEIWHFFTLADADRRELRVRFPRKGRLGAAVQLGFLRMTGNTLAAMDYMPRAVLKRLGTQLQGLAPEIATLWALYRVERTLYAHQSWACAYAGYRWPDRVDADAVIQILEDGTAVTLDSQRLAQQAREALVQRHCLIPRQRDIADWVREAVHRVELQDRQCVEQAVWKGLRDSWLPQLLLERRPGPELALSLASSMTDPTVSDAVFRAQCRQVLAPWRPEVRQRRRSRAEQVRLHLMGDIRRVRPVLKHLIEIGLQSQGLHEVLRALGELAYCYGQREYSLYWSATSPAGHAWDDLILAPNREDAFKAYEAETLWEARRGLRNGSLWLPHAEQYGGRHRLLLPPPRWRAAREGFLVRHRLPENADEFIERTLDQVGLQAAVASGDIEINEGGFVYMRDDPAVRVERGDADLLRTRLYAHLGRVQLTQLLLAIDGETHFTWELLGSAPSVAEELVPLYAAIFVAAMGLDTTDVAMMIPGVRLSDIRRASMLLEEEKPLRRANDRVVEFLLAQPLSKAWGEGFEASSDLMSLDVSRHLWLSRVDPKRRRPAIGTYTHVLDQWAIAYDQPLLLATRQAGAAIEGAVRQSITRLERLAVDTHGYTDFGMTVAKLLGFDLCPRLYSLRDRHLHVPRGYAVPETLAPIVHRDVALEPIRDGWEELLHLAASIEEGWRTATVVLERFGSAARGDRVHRAGQSLGQLLRTTYLCDYFSLPDFRRPLCRVLERGESVLALQRQICTQPLPAKRGRRVEELIASRTASWPGIRSVCSERWIGKGSTCRLGTSSMP